jgi:hypothetical protein
MDDTNFDGECHALTEKHGYIAKRISCQTDATSGRKCIDELFKKYAEYLYENDREKTINYLISLLKGEIRADLGDDFQLIHQPFWLICSLAQYGTLGMKFKRSKHDNLGAGC